MKNLPTLTQEEYAQICKEAEELVRGIYGKIYDKLEALGVFNVPAGTSIHAKSNGFMDLVVENLAPNRYSLTHYFEMNGDLVPDPDMEIRVFPQMKQAEALSFQDQFGYRAVYPEEDKIDVKAKKELNDFLNYWLGNLQQQGFKIP